MNPTGEARKSPLLTYAMGMKKLLIGVCVALVAIPLVGLGLTPVRNANTFDSLTSEVSTVTGFEMNRRFLRMVTENDLVRERVINATITLGTADSAFVVSPFTGTIAKVWTVIDRPLTTANEVLKVRSADGDSLGSVTIAYSGSAAGDVDSVVPRDSLITAGDKIILGIGGENNTAAVAHVTIVLRLN